jgi:hypothetical protein
MRIARAAPSARAFSAEQTMAAAASSLIGAHIGSVSGHDTSRAASTSLAVIESWYWALGLSEECRWFFAETSAMSRWVVPKRCM